MSISAECVVFVGGCGPHGLLLTRARIGVGGGKVAEPCPQFCELLGALRTGDVIRHRVQDGRRFVHTVLLANDASDAAHDYLDLPLGAPEE